MRFSLRELAELIGRTGLPDPEGFPLVAIMSAIAVAEGGDPEAWIPHDPPDKPQAGPSSGLFQVSRDAWPDLYEATEAVRLDSRLSPEEKVLRETEIVQPIIETVLIAALNASRILKARGFEVNMLRTALFIDAAWQAGSGKLTSWAARTETGDLSEIVSANRTSEVEIALRSLVPEILGVSSAMAVAAAVIIGLGLAALAISQWAKPRKEREARALRKARRLETST